MKWLGTKMQLALRERRRSILLFGLWVVLSILCAVAGPFGTFDVLNFGGRLAYWMAAVGVSVLSANLPVLARGRSMGQYLAIWGCYVLFLSAFFHGVNLLVFDGWQGAWLFFYLLGTIGLTVGAVHAVIWMISFAQRVETAAPTDLQARFLRRIPLADRGPLVRLEAQDHYLLVVTEKGTALILLRLSEAVAELAGGLGLQVHRSHWVAINAVSSHRREKGRDLLVMKDGAEIPVSRSNRAAAKQAGLL